MPRIALITGRRAAPRLRDLASMLRQRTGWDIDVVEVPIDVAALIPREVLREVLRSIQGRYDAIIVPGTLGYDVSEFEEDTGAPIIKGPEDPGALLLLSELGEKGLAELKKLGRLEPSLLLDKWLKELRQRHDEAEGIDICSTKVPIRPPPIVIAAEVYVEPGDIHVDEAVEKAKELSERGADVIVAGFSTAWSSDEAYKALKRIAEAVEAPVAIDTPDRVLAARAAAEELTCLVFTLGIDDPLFDVLPQGTAVVVAPFGKNYSLPSDPVERAEVLSKLVKKAREKGLIPVADPVLNAPSYGFAESVVAYYEAARRITSAPLLAGIANVYELVDADSTGQVAVLTQLLGELGASVLLVTEESRKAVMAVTEAAIAATMTSISLMKKRPPKDLGIDLLLAKEKRAKTPIKLPRKPQRILNASIFAAWHGFRQDLLGSHVIATDNNTIRDVYIGRKGVIELRGGTARDIYKAVSYLRLASEPSHYAYLGYELCKAELATKLRRSYVQEEEIINPPWSRCRFYNARKKDVKKLRD